MARIAIVGVGAIGGVLAGLLQTTGAHELLLCTRRPLPALRVDTPEGVIAVSAENITDPATPAPVDWILIATKTYDAAGAATWIPRLLNSSTMVAVVQNGIEHRRNFAGYVPAEQIVPVIIDVPAERRPDGTVLQRSDAWMRVEDDAAGAAFAALFAGSRAHVELTADFRSAAWRKLCLNSAGVISALTLKPAGVLRDQDAGELALTIMAECAAVARAEGAQLEENLGETILKGYRAGSPDSINSLLGDRIAGRPTEIDARNGIIVRLGERHGIPTPANRMAVTLLRAMIQ